MRRGTTPTYVVHFIDLRGALASNIKSVCIALKQTSTGVALYKHIPEDGGAIASDGAYITLTQQETRRFAKGRLTKQAIVTFTDGTIVDNDIEREQVVDVLHEVDH